MLMNVHLLLAYTAVRAPKVSIPTRAHAAQDMWMLLLAPALRNWMNVLPILAFMVLPASTV